ncbi:hypothetical protein MKK70_05860 [Methylobacterium sp. E-041]|uniref:hypothetical protein n=1 Tax=Methylobacterium sp. E-041 TaxID=2836573 RepID=UPI001FBB7E5C|nr:hypothetical protein [Methylobacterium sp. E-041]MCJ2104912.1 hypothetical protein [Methylobacterium sp. E-041]
MDYFEALPENCPIDKAKDEAVSAVWRVVSQDPPGAEDFLSLAALGVACSEIGDPCRHASCSMFKSKIKALNIARRLPKARVPAPHLSLCEIKIGHGKSYTNKKKHVDFWPYAGFDPAQIVLSTQSVDLADQMP